MNVLIIVYKVTTPSKSKSLLLQPLLVIQKTFACEPKAFQSWRPHPQSPTLLLYFPITYSISGSQPNLLTAPFIATNFLYFSCHILPMQIISCIWECRFSCTCLPKFQVLDNFLSFLFFPLTCEGNTIDEKCLIIVDGCFIQPFFIRLITFGDN